MTDHATDPTDPLPTLSSSSGLGGPAPVAKPPSARDRIIEATMELAAERDWSDFSLNDIAVRAGISLADFRDAFPSKGAVLGGLSRKIDRIVLDGSTGDLEDESPKERLFDVLMRRLDALTPYRLGLEGVAEWARTDPLSAAALNQVALNSMRFMLAAAGIDTEGGAGALKVQGLVIAWTRVLSVWFEDDDPGLARTMAALDRELDRGARLSARVDDVERLVNPLRLLGRAVLDSRRRMKDRSRRTSLDDAESETELRAPAGAVDPAI